MPNSRLNRIVQRKQLLNRSMVILGIILLVSAALIAMRFVGFYQTIHTEAQETDGTQKQEEKTEYTLLLMGHGGGRHDGAFLTDTIMVAHIDIKQKKAILVSIPRDIWVKVPTKTDPFHSKINAVYQMGLFPKNYPDVDSSLLTEENPSGLIKQVITDITGLKVDAFAAVDFQGFIKAIDTLEGIDVAVERSFTDYEYPIEGKENELCDREEEFAQIEPILNNTMSEEDRTKLYEEKPELEQFVTDIKTRPPIAFPCRYEILHFDAGDMHMDGETALKYARSRHALEDGGDFNRAQRQQNVIEAAKKKVLTIGFIPKIIPLLDELEEHVTTDLPLADLNKLLFAGRNANDYTVDTLILTDEFLTDGYSDYGGYIILPKAGEDNWSEVQRAIDHMKRGITPSPTPDPSLTVTPR